MSFMPRRGFVSRQSITINREKSKQNDPFVLTWKQLKGPRWKRKSPHGAPKQAIFNRKTGQAAIYCKRRRRRHLTCAM
jgi:hypothetical protein